MAGDFDYTDLAALQGSVGVGASGSGGATAFNSSTNPNIRISRPRKTMKYLGSSLSEVDEPEVVKTKDDAFKDFYALTTDSDDLKTLQERLYKAGYYGNLQPTDINFGKHDSRTAKAYSDFLDFAASATKNNADATLDSVLDEEMAAYPETGTTFQIGLPNEDNMKAVINATAPNILGRRLNPDETKQLMTAYTNAAVSSQQQKAMTNASGGFYVAAPEFDQAYIADQLRQQNPGEAAAHDFADQYKVFNELIAQSAAAVRSA